MENIASSDVTSFTLHCKIGQKN
ncbi:hypothetical protein MESS2_760097 [Mesorhizobium metallidurans STM 2683]|uniref:Uncharacterized protein n=1 Tax=Mesorhizobium metallidurans STM 2683 TaxID=1297569 RepID=M5EX64_9HYPH|nr:hypothetical protein MESS2_760097 [Mesorhizobium metallidurans STM 2683]